MNDQASVAVVVGSGISGLLAARALSDRFNEVIVVDRRPLGGEAFEATVPQGEHLHVLLKRGQLVIERLFPGLLAELEKGGMRNDWGGTTFWANPYGLHPVHPTDVSTLQFSRELLDQAIMQRLSQRKNVRFRTGVVKGLLGDSNSNITGVRLEEGELKADLVVDCRGRSSPILEELGGLGYAAPEISRVDNEMGYSSAFFEATPSDAPWQLVYLQVRPGLINRGGAACAIAPGKIIVTLIGTGDDRPEAGEDDFRAFARSLNHPEISSWIEKSKLSSKPKVWRNLSNVRRHFGRMKRWPRGLLVLGDALCAFNPVYGQGMTVGAIQAEALSETLATVKDVRATAWEHAFQKSVEKLLFIPWFMSTTEDLRNPKFATPNFFMRTLHGYFDLVLRAAVNDRSLHVAFLRIMHMMNSPFSLMSPGALVRVFARTVTRFILPPPSAKRVAHDALASKAVAAASRR